MSIESIPGPLKFIDSESITVSTSDESLTSAAYTKTTSGNNETANICMISTLDEDIFISFANSSHSTPGSTDEGILWKSTFGPFFFNGDLSTIRLVRAGGTDADVNVSYFIPTN